MATINCPECNTEIDSEIAVCPCCGFPIKKKPTTQTEPKLSEVPTQPISEEKRKQKKLIGTVR